MLRSLDAGVSGLQNQQVRLDVIGNNIANVNTIGYKAQRVNFQQQFEETLRGGAAPSGNLGGTNPSQVGLGVQVGSIDTLQTQGSLAPTGKNTDMAISGNGFFVIGNGTQQVYTRDGSFDFDRAGNFVKISNGFKVLGWNATVSPSGQTTINTNQPPQPIVVPAGATINPQATNNINIGSNLEETTPTGTAAQTSVTFYDSVGNVHKGSVLFTKNAAANTWGVSFVPLNPSEFAGGAASYALGSITFDAKGVLSGITPVAPGSGTQMVLGLSAATAGAFNPLSININVGTIAQTNGLTQFNDPKTDPSKSFYNSTIVMTDQDGYSAGSLASVSVDGSGTLNGIFTNGRSRALGQVALANFTNPAGLSVDGSNVFSQTPNSGAAEVGVASSGSLGTIAPGSLENSNVDLAQSFSDLIVAQRGLQSNSKIITTSDEVLQTLLQLKQ